MRTPNAEAQAAWRARMRAVCPECGRTARTFLHHGREIFQHHTSTGHKAGRHDEHPDYCSGSGWIVEAEDHR